MRTLGRLVQQGGKSNRVLKPRLVVLVFPGSRWSCRLGQPRCMGTWVYLAARSCHKAEGSCNTRASGWQGQVGDLERFQVHHVGFLFLPRGGLWPHLRLEDNSPGVKRVLVSGWGLCLWYSPVGGGCDQGHLIREWVLASQPGTGHPHRFPRSSPAS